LLHLSEQNAKENFAARYGSAREDAVLKELARELNLEQTPRIIECADVSHFQGGSTVASIVCFVDGHPDKSRYRHFHLSQEGKPDDFASMNEVVTRHLSRGAEENTLADLLVIDGGPPQLLQARAARQALSLQSPVLIGLAKKRTGEAPYLALGVSKTVGRGKKPERIYVEDRPAPVIPRSSSAALHLLERLRDEAHRFAITFHRSTRTKRAFISLLDSIPGVGLKRRKDLLRAFGSARAIAEAEPQSVAEKCNMPIALAQRIVGELRRRMPRRQESAPE
jgi:excinuclease ABC subunit C